MDTQKRELVDGFKAVRDGMLRACEVIHARQLDKLIQRLDAILTAAEEPPPCTCTFAQNGPEYVVEPNSTCKRHYPKPPARLSEREQIQAVTWEHVFQGVEEPCGCENHRKLSRMLPPARLSEEDIAELADHLYDIACRRGITPFELRREIAAWFAGKGSR